MIHKKAGILMALCISAMVVVPVQSFSAYDQLSATAIGTIQFPDSSTPETTEDTTQELVVAEPAAQETETETQPIVESEVITVVPETTQTVETIAPESETKTAAESAQPQTTIVETTTTTTTPALEQLTTNESETEASTIVQ